MHRLRRRHTPGTAPGTLAITEPSKVERILEKFTDGVVNMSSEMAANPGVDAIKISSPFAGMGFFSPEFYRQFELPYLTQVSDAIKASHKALFALGVKSVGLFGSFVRGEVSSASDVDLLVEFDADKKTFDNFMDTCFLLEEMLGRKVEVVTPDSISSHLKPYILKELEYVALSS